MRIGISGAPKTGKTTYSQSLARELNTSTRSTDDAMHLGWSDASAEVSNWFDSVNDWIIEGVALARALRKWLERNAQGKPLDKLIITTNKPFESYTPGQASMSKGIDKVMNEILPSLKARGVEIEYKDLSK
jgi:uridine kinase